MRIPEIQTKLIAKAQQYNDPEIMELALALSRRAPIGRAPVKSARMTPELRRNIEIYAKIMPGPLSQLEIGRVFNVNPGRVSEVLAGKRT